MSITNTKKLVEKIMIPYILLYEIMLLGRLIGLYSLIPSQFDTFIFTLLAFVGIVIILVEFFYAITERNFRRYNYLLIFFILAIILSTLFNHSENVISNLKLVLWQVMLMFVIYEAAKNPESKKIFKYVELIILVASFLIVTISLGMFFMRFSYIEKVDKLYYGLRMGFVENRLYGLFYDPNFGATISVVAIVISVKDIYRKILLPRMFNYLNVVFQLAYIALSGSRTAILELTIIVGIGTFFITYQVTKKDEIYLRLLKSILILVCSSAIIFFGIFGLKKGLTLLVNTLPGEGTNIVVSDDQKVVSEDMDKVTLTRKDVSAKEDISNDRFALWESAVEIFETTPIFGTTPRNLVNYARENLPNNYIAQSAHTPHNFFFYLLATTGLLGTLPFIAFLLRRMWQSLYQLFTTKDVFTNDFLFDNLVVLTILISACFLTDIVMVNRIGGFFFWLYLGKITTNFSARKTVI